MSSDTTEAELLELNEALLDSIAAGDWDSYIELCAGDLTCFEPESRGHLVEGMEFHRYYFELPKGEGPVNMTMSTPQVRILGPDAAVISYARLTQRLGADGAPVTSRTEETRIWQRIDGRWRHVHFHRSVAT
ncbi:MAG: nuclear transport factor 2 family protein [Planctomycetes bacterium]|nr:nuclear transport factor 2 family protein [Planctomycetota bacterium]